MPSRGGRAFAPALLIAAFLPIAGVVAQTTSINRADQYGNARPRLNERRPSALFQNNTQRRAFRGFQDTNRRSNNRGGLVPFSFGSIRSFSSAGRQARYRAALQYQSSALYQPRVMARTGIIRPSQAYAFQHYGGFAERAGAKNPSDLPTILARPAALTRANALNAPVDRAMWRRGAAGELASFARETPFEAVLAEELPADAPTLGEQVRMRVSLSNEAVRHRAWQRFKDRAYRSAARAFEGAYVLQPGDFEAQIGEFFATASLGSLRTSGALVSRIARDVENPFLFNLQLPERFASKEDARGVLILVQRFAEINSDAVEAKAVRALVLWHLREREEAKRLAPVLATMAPDSAFADWPEKMAIADKAFRLTGD